MKQLLVATVVIILLGTGIWWLRARLRAAYEPRRVSPNVVFQETGRFRSTRGPIELRVWTEPSGQLKYYVELKPDDEDSPSRAGGGPTAAFRPNSDWMMCWDTRDRLWVYVPDHDARHCTCWYAYPNGFGGLTPGEHGGWDGVPEAFLARLPEPAKAVYRAGSAPAVPAATTR
jgi:hypothetical protein